MTNIPKIEIIEENNIVYITTSSNGSVIQYELTKDKFINLLVTNADKISEYEY